MSKTVKIVLAVVAVAGVGGYLWVKKASARMEKEGKVATETGKAFGAGKAAQACVDEAMRRSDATTGIVDQALNGVFMSSCLDEADVSAEFCAGVPKRDEITTSVTWTVATCTKLGRPGDQKCQRLLRGIQTRCSA